MIKFLKLFFIFYFLISCSLKDTTGFWSQQEKLNKVENKLIPLFKKENILSKEFNTDFSIDLDPSSLKLNLNAVLDNNDGYTEYSGNLEKISKYNFSKIDNYEQADQELIFFGNNVIFFDNKGTILNFDHNSKLIWKTNIYSKDEKKLSPKISMSKNDNSLIVTDNLSKLYALNMKDGSVLWSKNHITPFNSQIKIFKNYFFVVDSNNVLICYSVNDGEKIWLYETEKPFVNSIKKLSIVIKDDLVVFNNSVGEITGLNLDNGSLEWQISTQNIEDFSELIDFKTSDLIINDQSIYFSNNKNNFFSIDLNTGSINWKQKIDSFIKPTIVGNLVFTISEDGYFFVIEKNSGNIIRINNIFKNQKIRKKNPIYPTGFILNYKDVFISTNKGRLFIMKLDSGIVKDIIKVSNSMISRASIKNGNMYLVKDNSILKLN